MIRSAISVCFGAALAAAIALAAVPASANVIFNLTGTCLSFCGSTGQNSGDPISGFVEFNDFDTAADGSFLVPDSYHLEFGNVVLDSTTPPPASDYFLKGGHDTLQKIDALHIGPGSLDVWSATVNVPIIFLGNCYGCDASHWAFGFAPGSYGTFAFTRETALPTPAPAALTLFAPGLALIGFLRRRKRA